MARSVKPWQGKTDDSRPPVRVILRLMEKQRNICACGCGVKFSPGEGPPEADHIVALVNGGSNTEDNLQLLRPPCHKVKTGVDVATKSHNNARRAKHYGLKRKKPWSKFKRRMDGTVIERSTGAIVKRPRT